MTRCSRSSTSIEQLGISFDRFIRTTDADHKALCQQLWQRMADNGDLYLDRYEGWYSVRDEAYYDESELVTGEDASGQPVKLSPQGTPVEWTVEESWFFKLSAYAEPLLKLYEDHPDFIQPSSRFNEMRAFVAGGLKDLSMSRTSFDWGVPVPGSPGHVMYVWVDALANYLTGAGGIDGEWWPADLHVVGKDVVRFHAIYWPAFLMSAGQALPKTVFGHGFVLNRGVKMSKSDGNVVDPAEMADALRGRPVALVPAARSRLWRGRQLQRRSDHRAHQCRSRQWHRQSGATRAVDGDQESWRRHAGRQGRPMAPMRCTDSMKALTEAYFAAMNGLQLHRALEAVMAMVNAANGYFADNAPWKLAKTDVAAMGHVLDATLDATRRIVLLVQPVMPEASARLLDLLGVAVDAREFKEFNTVVATGTQLPEPQGVFPRWAEPA